MITLIAEIIISIFISNFKSEDHPYLINFFKVITIGLIGYALGNIVGYIENHKVMEYSKQILFFIVTQFIGFVCFIFLSMVDFLNGGKNKS
ncbi:hypothetical protein NDM229_006090 [Acinetobacter bereziniae]|nr:hypothetical protein NDM229_006090 [Acinetobacter bereziniae]